MKPTPQLLSRLEAVFGEAGYAVRYEKGSFKAGYCLLKETKVAVVNKYFTTEGKINCLLEMLKTLPVDADALSHKNQQLYWELVQ